MTPPGGPADGGGGAPGPPAVVDDEAAARFTLTVDGHLAELVYRRVGDRLVLVHTGVPPELEGRGLGGRLVQAALARARRDGLAVVPQCPFARAWIERHPGAAEGLTVLAP